MNVKLLREVKKHILAEPRRWTFCWSRRNDEAPCGTQACIGGWTVILGNKIKLSSGLQFDTSNNASEARKLLGLTEKQSERLFFYWPDKFNKREDVRQSAISRARNAAARIEHFIKTKGRG